MIITYWCPTCRQMHGSDAVSAPDATNSAWICARTGKAVSLRGIPDDPDDPNYGKPRCRLCRAELKVPSASCPECGTAIG